MVSYIFILQNSKTLCPECFRDQRETVPKPNVKLTIEEMQSIAKARGGKCIFKKYINAHSKLKFHSNVCSYTWRSTPSSIRKGELMSQQWCIENKTKFSFNHK